MSDVSPKIKIYLFVSIIQLIFNIIVWIFSNMGNEVSYKIEEMVVQEGVSAFLPFVSLVGINTLGIPNPLLTILNIITGIMSSIQTFIIAMVVISIASNILWHPDV